MNKKFAAALSGGAVLMLVLSGCGGDESDDKANAWAKKVCDQWQPELTKTTAANEDIKRVATADSKADEVQKTYSAAFATFSESYKKMGTALQEAGAPPAKEGPQTLDKAVKGFEASSKGYADLKVKIDALPPQDPGKFADGLKEVGAGIKDAAQGEDDARAALNAGGMGNAMNSQPGCKLLVSSPTPK